MRTNIVLKGLEIAGVKIAEVVIEQEYSVKEIVDLSKEGRNFVKETIKELPEMIEDLKAVPNLMETVEKVCESPIVESLSQKIKKRDDSENFKQL